MSVVVQLDLRCNQLGPNGGRAVAQMLQMNNSLTDLNLQKNGLSDDSCVALSKALRTNPSLTALNVRFNDVGDTGALAFADLLRVNDMLSSLDLGGNRSRTRRICLPSVSRPWPIRVTSAPSNVAPICTRIRLCPVPMTHTRTLTSTCLHARLGLAPDASRGPDFRAGEPCHMHDTLCAVQWTIV